MSDLSISLFGSPKVYIDNIEVKFQRRKTLALLIYLSVTNCTQSRDKLTEMFYPDLERNRAKSDFRQLLYRLKKVLGDERVQADRFSITLDLSNNVCFDIFKFNNLIKPCKDRHDSIDDYKAALDCYQGDFLSGFYLDNNYSFEEWQLSNQEEYYRKYISILEIVINSLCEENNYDEAIRLCKKWNILNPLDEQSHRILMTLYYNSSQTEKMIDQFKRCKKLINSELNAELEDSTYQLYSELLEKLNQEHSVGYLPDNRTALIGRKKELIDLTQILLNRKASLITLVGSGGVGKTLLSLHLAMKLKKNYEQGMYFIDLSGITSVKETIFNISRKLEILNNQTNTEDSLTKLKRFLKNYKILLILDNFEQIVKGPEFIKDLISSSNEYQILITSRIELGIKEELVYHVQPLNYSSKNLEQANMENIQDFDSVILFIARAKNVIPGFAPDNDNLSIIQNICKSLDGIPLAIELAASRLKLLTCKEIESHLTERLKLLVNESPDLPDRQKTMKKTIAWSYELLSNTEKDLLNTFSVFEGGATLEAVEYIYESNTMDLTSSLLGKNMLIRKESQGNSRYYMLETIREYGQLKLKESDNFEKIREKYAYYYLSLAEKAEIHLHGPNQIFWKDRLIEDDKNIINTIRWFDLKELHNETIQMIVSLFPLWHYNSRHSEISEILKKHLNACNLSIPPQLQTRAYNDLGWLAFICKDWKPLINYYNKALEINANTGDKKLRSSVLNRLGYAEKYMGQIELSRKHGMQSITLARESNDPYSIMIALQCMYNTRGLIRDEDPLNIKEIPPQKITTDEKQIILEEILSISKDLEDLFNRGWALVGFGDHYKKRGLFELAQRYYERALDIYKIMKDKWSIAWYRGDLGWLFYLKGNIDKGQEYLKQSILLLLRLDDSYNAIIMIGRLSRLLWDSGKNQEAIRFLAVYRNIFLSLVGTDSVKYNYYVDPVIEDLITKYSSRYREEWVEGQLWEYKDLIRELSKDTPIF